MEPVLEHPVPAGPLAIRWLAWTVPEIRAGTLARLEVELENAGLAPWDADVNLAYHWLDERGNAIVWDGIRTPLALAPGDRAKLHAPVRGPIPPGRYRLTLDLVSEHRFWFAELGNHVLEREVDVGPRDASTARAHLPEGATPAPDWHERVRALHEEGYAAVGGSIAHARARLPRRDDDPELEPYVPGGGRNPAFAHPLVCPSLLAPLEPNAVVAGLPAWRPARDEPWIYDGRATVVIPRSRSRRRPA
ncbi:MAG TPA: hypothetical protein VH416_06055 [Gaiellaceae bacterium]